MGPGYAGTTTNLQIVLNIPPKNAFSTRATQNYPRIENFKPPKNLRSSPSLEFGFPLSTPLGLSLALTEHRGNLAMVYWNEKTLGTRKRTNYVINFRLVQTNKQETTELLLTAHKWPQKIIQFRVYTVLLSNSRDGLSLEVSSKQVKEVYVI